MSYTLVLVKNTKCNEKEVMVKAESAIDVSRFLKLLVFTGEYKVREVFIDGQPIEPEVLRVFTCL